MTRLAAKEPQCAEFVKLKFFAGLTKDEAAGASASLGALPTGTGPTPALAAPGDGG